MLAIGNSGQDICVKRPLKTGRMLQLAAEFGLIRSIRKWDLVSVTVNAVIGAGIFGLPSRVYALVGSYRLPAFLLCGVFAAMIVMCFAEVGSRFTETGAPYLYTREVFGPTAGFTVGWLMWIART